MLTSSVVVDRSYETVTVSEVSTTPARARVNVVPEIENEETDAEVPATVNPPVPLVGRHPDCDRVIVSVTPPVGTVGDDFVGAACVELLVTIAPENVARNAAAVESEISSVVVARSYE